MCHIQFCPFSLTSDISARLTLAAGISPVPDTHFESFRVSYHEQSLSSFQKLWTVFIFPITWPEDAKLFLNLPRNTSYHWSDWAASQVSSTDVFFLLKLTIKRLYHTVKQAVMEKGSNMSQKQQHYAEKPVHTATFDQTPPVHTIIKQSAVHMNLLSSSDKINFVFSFSILMSCTILNDYAGLNSNLADHLFVMIFAPM